MYFKNNLYITIITMNIKQIKRALDDADIWYSCLHENDDINISEVTTVPYLQSEMHKKLVILTNSGLREAERSGADLSQFINVILDSKCVRKYLRKLSSCNLILVGSKDIGKVIVALNEAVR